ncbi:MAG: exonuclease SbcCD subunit D [Anaerolineaceae bacterium]
MVKILHFADAHIDIANYGQHAPRTGLPARVMDFLKSLDTIVDTAIQEKVDLVIFAGDAYRNRHPEPTFQREWGKRIMRLSHASIPTILLTGNHDMSPSQLNAHALQEFHTLEVPFVHVINKPRLLGPQDLDNVPVQVIALPWITRSGVLAAMASDGTPREDTNILIENALTDFVADAIQRLDPDLPVILTAHASISGADYGNEQTIKIGRDVLLQPGFVRNPRFDYVALGHIHKYQNLNEGSHPPVVYPGSIERVDFGEVKEEKGFVLAEVAKGKTRYTWRKLAIRPYIDRVITLEDGEGVTGRLLAALPSEEAMKDAVVRLTIHYPRQLETLIDEADLREKARLAFMFYLVKSPHADVRSRLPEGQVTSSMTPLELLGMYWKENHVEEQEQRNLEVLAAQIMSDVQGGVEA